MTSVTLYRATRTNGKQGKQGKDPKKRLSGKWRMKWRDPDGKVWTESTGTASKDVAKQIKKRKEDELALDPWGLTTQKRERKPWEGFVTEFLEYKRATRRAGTADAYSMSLAPVTRILVPKYLKEVATVSALQKFAGVRSGEVAAETVNKDLRTLRAALRFADERGYIIKAPSFKGVMVKTNKKKPICLKLDVQAKLVAAVDAEDFKPRFRSREWWRVFLLLIRETGVRRGELLGLEWERVDGAARTIKIEARTSKGCKDRVLPLAGADELWAVLKNWRERVEGDRVFPWDKKTYRQFYQDWGRLLATAGLPKGVVPKNLRSTTGSEMVSAGVFTLAVKDWLGHSSVTTTETYYANTEEALQEAAEGAGAEGAERNLAVVPWVVPRGSPIGVS